MCTSMQVFFYINLQKCVKVCFYLEILRCWLYVLKQGEGEIFKQFDFSIKQQQNVC